MKSRVKELRKKTGLSQSKFAAYFGIPVKTLQCWEGGFRNPPEYIPGMMERILELEYFPNQNPEEETGCKRF